MKTYQLSPSGMLRPWRLVGMTEAGESPEVLLELAGCRAI